MFLVAEKVHARRAWNFFAHSASTAGAEVVPIPTGGTPKLFFFSC